jgi:hypothetical protein
MVEQDVGELFICVGVEVIGSRKATANWVPGARWRWSEWRRKRAEKKFEGAVETENESLLRIKNTNYVCTPIL